MAKNRKTGKSMTVKWLFVIFIFIAQLFFYTWSRVQCIKTGYEIMDEAKNCKKLINMQKNLKLELASLKSQERLSKIAEYELGLAAPLPNQIIIMP